MIDKDLGFNPNDLAKESQKKLEDGYVYGRENGHTKLHKLEEYKLSQFDNKRLGVVLTELQKKCTKLENIIKLQQEQIKSLLEKLGR